MALTNFFIVFLIGFIEACVRNDIVVRFVYLKVEVWITNSQAEDNLWTMNFFLFPMNGACDVCIRDRLGETYILYSNTKYHRLQTCFACTGRANLVTDTFSRDTLQEQSRVLVIDTLQLGPCTR